MIRLYRPAQKPESLEQDDHQVEHPRTEWPDILATIDQATPTKIANITPSMRLTGHIFRSGSSSGVAPVVSSSHNLKRIRSGRDLRCLLSIAGIV